MSGAQFSALGAWHLLSSLSPNQSFLKELFQLHKPLVKRNTTCVCVILRPILIIDEKANETILPI